MGATHYFKLGVFALTGVDPKAFPPAAISWKPEAVYVSSVPSTATLLSGAIEHLSAELQKINLPSPDSTRSRTTSVDQTLSGVSAAATNAGPFAADMRRTMHEVRGLIAAEEDDLRSAIADLRSVVENLNAVAEDARRNPSRVLFSQPPP
ncbi:MAG TPA: hypothetical protein VGI81_07700 [Tepidisphaeraceae bacterium]|jgi:ABC-type transporter Mla subunit MlaD